MPGPVAQGIEQRFPKPLVGRSIRPGAAHPFLSLPLHLSRVTL